ncbi:MAG: glycosyltransferase 87 family protein [Gaiellaceae bacterium]
MQRADRRRAFVLAVAVLASAIAIPLAARAAQPRLADDTLWANAAASIGGTMRPGDFGYVFLVAGDDVLAGRNPYMDADDFEGPPQAPYAYPPVLAVMVAPLSALPEYVRGGFLPGVLFSLLLIAAMVGGLWLLGVRDWRCYPVALLAPFTLEAFEYGAIGPVLVLLVALAWRYRDRPLAAGAASGGLVVLKLFLWPVVAWLAFTARIRAAVAGVAVALALALVSWAAIAFRGLLEYPRLLRKLVDVEADQSYSAFAVLRALEIPEIAARALVAAAGIVLLGLAWRAARDLRLTAFDRDRRSLGLVLAAALVLTPILWLHYLVLLFVPIALARPRLSWLWFVPLALTVLEWRDWYRGWPRGELDSLLSVAIASAIVLVFALRAGSARPSEERVGSARA